MRNKSNVELIRKEFQWKVMNCLPADSKTISHLKLVEILQGPLIKMMQEKQCDYETLESLNEEMIDQLVSLQYSLSQEIKLEMRAGVYHVGWCELAANMPTVRDDAKSTRVDRDAWVGEKGCRSDLFRLRVSQSDVIFNF